MPCYPALALLLAPAITSGSKWIPRGARAVGVVAALAAIAIAVILMRVWNLPAPGDISRALTQNPDAYTLSLGHMGDLTIDSFAYLKTPLVMAGVAFVVGAFAGFRNQLIGLAVMMVLFLHAARAALVTFDPYLGSRPLAETLPKDARLIADNQYYTFSSLFFYANPKSVLLLNGRVNNLEYGSYAPGAPEVFIDDARFSALWTSAKRYYLAIEGPSMKRIETLVGRERLHIVKASGGKFLLTNQP